ncbi:unnamed protein product [Cylicostephanus goldi]|uniref:Uncharacterized protein n=1 Tax=Cylicostephanus goldi TaxID=71465 RepID=A0A3P6RKK6_CYLGO|nr:unnamed protein product [Cylicostephanus goldi]
MNDDGSPKVEIDAPPPYYNQGQCGYDRGRQTRPSADGIINKGGGGYGGGGRRISVSALGGGLLGFGSAMLAGSLISYGFGSMWGEDETDEEEGGGGYDSDSDTNDTNGDVDYLDLSDPAQQPQVTSVIDNDDDNSYTGDAGDTGLDCHVADSDGSGGVHSNDAFGGGVSSSGVFGGGDYSSGDIGGGDCSDGDFGGFCGED